MTVRDIRYGRRSGRWARPGTGSHRQALADTLAAGRAGRRRVEQAAEMRFHPETLARHRAHRRGCAHRPATDRPAVADRIDRHALDIAPKGAAS